jgi:hypothetical protein
MQVDKVVGDEETGNCRRRRSNGKRQKTSTKVTPVELRLLYRTFTFFLFMCYVN